MNKFDAWFWDNRKLCWHIALGANLAALCIDLVFAAWGWAVLAAVMVAFCLSELRKL